MSVENDIFSNKYYLKQINKHFNNLIELIQCNFKPVSLSPYESIQIKEISFEFLQKLNGSNQTEQIQFLSNIDNLEYLWKFLSLNPTSYDCQNFLEELYHLTSISSVVKQHLSFHIEDFLLILGVTYDDHLRFSSFKILSLLINDVQLSCARLNRMCYESLYDFDIYYEKIQSLTIESRIIVLTKENLNDLINGFIIRKDLEEKIIEAINQLGGDVFFKMNRSPKDAYQNLCKEINGGWSDIWDLKADENPHLHFMKIRNLDQLKLLLKSSDRLQEDLRENCSWGKLIFRKWANHLPDEYRCFVCNGKLNAVSGNQSINDEQQIRDFINSKSFREIILSIPYSHGVVDCSIDPMNHQVIIIEINPFSKRSSAGKFSWVIDRDILYNYYDQNGFVCIRL